VTATDLRKLTIENLRGSTATLSLDFRPDAHLTVIYGENGSGKTTICDAIEFISQGTVGSLDDRGLGNRVDRYWPSLGKLPGDIRVTLEAREQTCIASIRNGEVEAQPSEARPRVAILRRTQILRVLDAQPARRYEEIRSFVDVGHIEQAEASLKVQVDSVSQQRNAAVAVIVENEDQLSRFWQAAGSPGVDHLEWAREETDREREDPAPVVAAIDAANGRYLAAKTNLERYEAGLARLTVADEAVATAQRVQAAAVDAEAGATDTLGLLEAAEEYLAHDHQDPTECPLCGSPDRAAGLLGRVRERIGSMQAIQDALRQLAQAQAVRVAASAALGAIEGDYQADREALVAAVAGYRALDPAAMPLPEPPSLVGEVASWAEQCSAVLEAWATIRARLQDEGQFLATLRSTLDNYDRNIAEQADLEALLPRLQAAHDIVRGERQAFTDDVLRSISARVAELYTQIHPDEGLGDLTMELNPNRRASLELATTFGGQAGVPPQAFYSQSHLDTLGICIFLALIEKDRPEETILVLDDVIASLDEPHVERLVRTIASVAAQFRHCLVTTHYRPWREKLRWGLLQDGSTELIELKRWTNTDGIQLARTTPEIERLRSALSADELDAQAVVGRAGVILEALLEHLTLTYECSLPRKRGTTPYALGELLDGIGRRLREVLRAEVLVESASGNVYESRPLGPILNDLTTVAQTRNAMGAHFTELSFELLDDDADRFGQLVLHLADAIVDQDAGWPVDARSGSYWANRGESRRLYPLQRPS
jgi:recombinational DNA repair ATPase RecF